MAVASVRKNHGLDQQGYRDTEKTRFVSPQPDLQPGPLSAGTRPQSKGFGNWSVTGNLPKMAPVIPLPDIHISLLSFSF